MGKHAEYRQLVGAALAAAIVAGAGPAGAQPCRLALAFALDVSASVDPGEYRLQLDGLADALRDPAVRAAILGPGGHVAFAAYEWSGSQQQAMISDWAVIAAAADLDAFAARIAAHPRQFGEFPTSVGYALGYGAVLLHRAPPCMRHVIDMSGDGVSNDGFSPEAAFRAFDFGGVTVNGLVVGGGDLDVISFYQSSVAHGPDAFVEVAKDYSDYHRAIRRKLLREVANDLVSALER